MFLSRKAGLIYVPRADVSAYDWVLTDFIADSSFRVLELPAIVPLNVVAVNFRLQAQASFVAKAFILQPYADANGFNQCIIYTHNASTRSTENALMPITSHKIKYWLQTGAGWNFVYLHCTGWLI